MASGRDGLALLHDVRRGLAGDVSLGTLAERSGRSPFAVQREFSRMAGESPKQYVLRVRLDTAAARLAATTDAVLSVALDAGFASHEVFTRAFRRRFGCSPSRYRTRTSSRASGADRRRHRAVVERAAPCVHLYRLSTHDTARRSSMPLLSIDQRTIAPQPILFVRLSTARGELAKAIGQGLGKSCGYALSTGHAMAGPPFVRYTSVGPGLMTIEAGAPLAAPAEGRDDVEAGELPGGDVVTALHAGAYDELQDTYAAIERWMSEHGLAPAGAPWESYLTDPAEHPNPADWRTEIYWPVKTSIGARG
ncbi:MAG: AraC family transcriptional regulator [Vicinamibacterales bacterium]